MSGLKLERQLPHQGARHVAWDLTSIWKRNTSWIWLTRARTSVMSNNTQLAVSGEGEPASSCLGQVNILYTWTIQTCRLGHNCCPLGPLPCIPLSAQIQCIQMNFWCCGPHGPPLCTPLSANNFVCIDVQWEVGLDSPASLHIQTCNTLFAFFQAFDLSLWSTNNWWYFCLD